MKHTRIHTLRHTPHLSQSAYTNSKPKITWNNAFSVKPKHKNSQMKIIRFTHPQPSLRKLSSTDISFFNIQSQICIKSARIEAKGLPVRLRERERGFGTASCFFAFFYIVTIKASRVESVLGSKVI